MPAHETDYEHNIRESNSDPVSFQQEALFSMSDQVQRNRFAYNTRDSTTSADGTLEAHVFGSRMMNSGIESIEMRPQPFERPIVGLADTGLEVWILFNVFLIFNPRNLLSKMFKA